MEQYLLLITEPYFTGKLCITAFIITDRFHKPDDLIILLIIIILTISINRAALDGRKTPFKCFRIFFQVFCVPQRNFAFDCKTFQFFCEQT